MSKACIESSTNVGEALVVFHCYIPKYMSHHDENSDYCKVDVLSWWCLLASRRRSRARGAARTDGVHAGGH
jgi:hypothetical protein